MNRRRFLLAAAAGRLRLDAEAACDPSTDGSRIVVMSNEPYWNRQGRPLGCYPTESCVAVPWEDPVFGGADPFIAVARNGEIFATTCTAPKLLRSADGGRTWKASPLGLPRLGEPVRPGLQ